MDAGAPGYASCGMRHTSAYSGSTPSWRYSHEAMRARTGDCSYRDHRTAFTQGPCLPDRHRRNRRTAHDPGAPQHMIGLPAGTRIWLVAGVTDMRCGFNGLSAKVQTTLEEDPFSGHCICVSRPARRYRQAAVVDRRWPVSARQASGTRILCLAAGPQRHGAPEPGTALDVDRRHRLAASRTYSAAPVGLVNIPAFA